jgi:hypothetical protein
MTKEYEPLIEALKRHVEQEAQEVDAVLNELNGLTKIVSGRRRTRAVRDERGNIIGSESVMDD